ncbi:MAG: M48 family metallopeptidase [Pseudomonadota bacterium]|nr:M48 family metallopeptidase [Pseudomonadota bacterium]
MSKRLISMAVLSSALVVTGCSSTTQEGATGVNRKQLLLVSSEEVNAMSAKSYQELLAAARQKNVLNRDAAMLARLRGVANRLTPHVSTFRTDARGWRWEVNTIQANDLNAFVMPGGKVMFYSGIVSRLQLTDDEIAAIMGHEIAHALREHARERISRDVAQQTGLGLLASVVGLTQGQAQAAGMAAQLGLQLPHSRAQEEEADVLGLELMARAGYNPQAALTLWQKMRKASQGEPPKFLSTHPSTGDRMAQIQRLLPRVMPIYQQARR